MDILILSGFLGSGKTSLLIALAREMVRRNPQQTIAVLENETGSVGIDNRVLAGSGLQVRELTSGCVCCTLKGELLATTLEIQKQIGPDLLIVEASGVAAPRIVAEAFGGYPEKIDSITLAVLLDLTRLDVLTGYSSYYVQGCIESADVLVLNKADAVGHDGLEHALAEVRAVKENVTVLPVSAQEGDGIPALIHALDVHAGSGAAKGLQAYDAAGRQDKLPNVVTCAQLREYTWPRERESGVLAQALQEIAQGIALDLKEAGCGLLGHIKVLFESGDARCLVRTVTFDGTPDIDNQLPGGCDRGVLIVNVIAYCLEKQELEEIVRFRLGQYFL